MNLISGSTTLLLATNNIADMQPMPTNLTEASMCIFNGVQKDMEEDCKFGLLKDYGVRNNCLILYLFSFIHKGDPAPLPLGLGNMPPILENHFAFSAC